MTYSFSYLEPVCCFMSCSNCCFLTCIQISQESGQVVWYSHHFHNFPQFIVIHTVSASKIDSYNRGGKKEKKEKKKSQRIDRTSQKIIINVFLESLLSASFPSLRVIVQFTSLECPPTLCWSLGPAVGAAQILIWSYSCVFFPPVSTAISTHEYFFCGSSH